MAVVHTAGIFSALSPWLGKQQQYDNINPSLIVRITRAETCVMVFEHQYVFVCRWDATFEGLLIVLGLWFLLCCVSKDQFVNPFNSVPPTKYIWGLKLSKIRLSISTLQQLCIFWNYPGKDGSGVTNINAPEMPAVVWACTETSKEMEEALVSCSLSKHSVAPWLHKPSYFKFITFSI